jgi:hypothetical protein
MGSVGGRSQERVRGRARTFVQRDDGVGTLEYLGVVVVAALLVTALVTAVVRADLGVTIACELRSIASQSGSCGVAAEPTTYGDTAAGPGGTASAIERDGEASSGPNYANAADNRPAADPDQVHDALGDLRDALDGGFWGVGGGDLDDAKEAVDGLNGAEVDALIAEMSDAELADWVDELDDGWLFGGWDRDQRRELWETFATVASRETLDRLGKFTDELQPVFNTVGGDAARDEPQSPANEGEYGELAHDLVINGVDPLDVTQGSIGDCWMVASMMAVAQADPTLIEDAITANANGSYTVRLYVDGSPVDVTVTPEMVLMPDGSPAFIDNGPDSDRQELWPLVLEKAVALQYGDFADIEGGTASTGLELLTGLPSTEHAPGALALADVAKTLDAGGAVGLSSLSSAGSNALYSADAGPKQLFTGHAYYVSAVNEKDGTVTVVNPWGIVDYPPITLTAQEFEDAFRAVRTNEVNR